MYSEHELAIIRAKATASVAVEKALKGLPQDYSLPETGKPALDDAMVRHLQGLSTGVFSTMDTLSSDDFAGYCYEVNVRLFEKLYPRFGNNLIVANSGAVPQDIPARQDPEIYRFHHYLSLRTEGVEIVIDPTIGQFLKGYKNVFIGTRDELKALFFNGQYEVINRWGNSPQDHWNSVWGNYPVPSKVKQRVSHPSRRS